MRILTVGDSFTFGLELSDLPDKDLDFFCRYWDESQKRMRKVFPSKLAWPNKLASILEAYVHNASMPGASNDWIFKRTIQYMSINVYDLVIVAWTCVDRYDFALGEQELQLSASNHHITEVFPWFKNFVTDHYDFALAYDKWICQALALEAFLKQQNVPYIFVNSIMPHMIQDSGRFYTNLKFDFKTKFDHRYYIDWDSGFTEWCCDLPKGPAGHFLEEGHSRVANRIYDFIVNNNILSDKNK